MTSNTLYLSTKETTAYRVKSSTSINFILIKNVKCYIALDLFYIDICFRRYQNSQNYSKLAVSKSILFNNNNSKMKTISILLALTATLAPTLAQSTSSSSTTTSPAASSSSSGSQTSSSKASSTSLLSTGSASSSSTTASNVAGSSSPGSQTSSSKASSKASSTSSSSLTAPTSSSSTSGAQIPASSSSSSSVPITRSTSSLSGSSSTSSSSSSSSSTTSAAPITVQSAGLFTYIGCYSDDTSSRTLTGASYKADSEESVESCASTCSAYQYFGVEWAQVSLFAVYTASFGSKCGPHDTTWNFVV